MWPFISATWLEAAISVDWVIFRELATTLKPRSTNLFTIPAPIPCEAPVTMAVFRGALMVICLENVLRLEKSMVKRSEIHIQHDVADRPGAKPRGTEVHAEPQHPGGHYSS